MAKHVACARGKAPCEFCMAVRWKKAIEEAVAKLGGKAVVKMLGGATMVLPVPASEPESLGGLLRFGMERPEWAGFEPEAVAA